MIKKRAWITKGTNCFYPTQSKSSNYSVISAITETEVVGFNVVKPSVTWDHFVFFVEYIYSKLRRMNKKDRNIILLYDGAKSHTSLINQRHSLNYLFTIQLPPYSP